MPYPVSAVWDFLVGRDGVDIWLGPGTELPRERGLSYETESGTTGQVRSFRPQDRVRLTWRPKDWDHDSTLQIALVAAGTKTTMKFHQEWLADADERAEQRVYWSDVIERLEARLAER
ncbi:SRPBCC family protein [Amycolatopsis nigrescens]|uniref:SRPBCC family protein n=1 Tax=Amycolatopsis nigrescens TaxID=381445 RepID=UPI001FDF00DF|nr:SRPBCC domain-containing protein [Amycolatopsis nigrescens]